MHVDAVCEGLTRVLSCHGPAASSLGFRVACGLGPVV